MGRLLVPLILLAAVAALFYASRRPVDPVQLWARMRPLVLFALAMLYLASPLDVIPDGSLIGILDDLAVLLAALYFGRGSVPQGDRHDDAKRGSADRRSSGRPTATGGGFDPYATLGVDRGASQEEITKAFRDKMKQYHPDRVADLGEELQKLAHEKAVEIRRAYDTLKKQ